jgi:thiosulfate/3-mercaptopyruvate sulfurtransferase
MRTCGLYLTLVCGLIVPLVGQTAPAPMLVSAEWLAGQLRTPDLVILHVGNAKDYEAGHIPGSRLIELAAIAPPSASGLRLEVPEEPVLLRALKAAGVSDNSRVVVYAAGPVLASTRVWFTLDLVGLAARASILDGGLAAWRATDQPVSTDVPAVAVQGNLNASIHAERLATVEWVREHLTDPGTVILDARLPQFYLGTDPGTMPRAGRIPGARNVPYTGLFDKDGKFLPEADLRRLLGVGPDAGSRKYVAYCHIGLQATSVYFAARRLGLDVKLYDGSFQEWSGMPNLPVETGPVGQ